MSSGMMVRQVLCAKTLAHVKDGKELRPMESGGDILNSRERIMLPLYGTIEVFRVQTDSQGAVFF